VGRTRYCIHPPQAVERIEQVGGTKDPKLERILALKPDLVFLNREENRREDWHRLREAGIACNLTYPRDVDGAMAAIGSIAAALDAAPAGEALIAGIQVVRATLAAERRKGGSCAYLIWRKPWMTINGDTYISGLLAEAGWCNVFAAAKERYPAIGGEDLRAAAPDLVMLSSEPFPFKRKHIAELATASDLDPARFRLVDGQLLSWHASFTAAGLAYAMALQAARA